MSTEIQENARLVPIERLRGWERNPRSITPERLEQLKRALRSAPLMLWVRPLAALPDGRVILGNQRLRAITEMRAAGEMGWETVPVVTVDLDERTAAEWAIRDNNEYGVWQEEELAALLREMQQGGSDLDLTGFDASELDRLLGSLEHDADLNVVDPEEIALPAKPRTKIGDVLVLGRHRLVCGDATDASVVQLACGGAAADVVWTDPPYGVNYEGKTRQRLTIQNDDAHGLPALLAGAYAAILECAKPNAPVYVAHPAGRRSPVFTLEAERAGLRVHQTLIWVKDIFVLGHSDYHYRHEPILLAYTPGEGRAGRGGANWYGGATHDSVFEVPRPRASQQHPTMKPVALIDACLRNSSQHGDLVLDLFGGSGSTLIAAELNGRRSAIVELDPAFCDVIRDRWKALTGGEEGA